MQNPNQTQNQFYNNIMRPRWTNQNNNRGDNRDNNRGDNRDNNRGDQRKKVSNNKNMNRDNRGDNRDNRGDNRDNNRGDNRDNRGDNRDKSNQKGYKFNQNVKNSKINENLNQQTQQVHTEETNQTVLLTSYLANLQPKEVRQILGERLYPLVSQISNNQSVGKITGMLLDMDTSEILLLLESPESLEIKVKQALNTLENAKKNVE